MASRQIKMPVKDDSDKEADEAPSQRNIQERNAPVGSVHCGNYIDIRWN